MSFRPIQGVQPFSSASTSGVTTGITPAGTYGYGVDRKWVVDANGNAVISSYRRLFNVLDYGATGDGLTDDGAAINTAIAAALAAGGGTIYFPPVTFITGGISTAGTGGAITANFLYGGIERNVMTLTIGAATDANPAHRKLTLDMAAATPQSEVYDNVVLNTTVGSGTSNLVDALVAGGGAMTVWPANGSYTFSGGQGGYLIQTALTCSIAASSGLSIRILGEYEASPLYVDLGTAVSSTTDCLTATIVSGYNGRIEIENLLFMGVDQSTVWNVRRCVYLTGADQNQSSIVRCGAYQLAAYKSIFETAGTQTWMSHLEFKGVAVLSGSSDNGCIVGNGTRQFWVDGIILHDYSNWKGLTYNLGSCGALAHFLAPAADFVGMTNNNMFYARNIYADENAGPVKIENYSNYRAWNVHISDYKCNTSTAVAGTSCIYLYQCEEVKIERVFSGYQAVSGDAIIMWDAGNVIIENLNCRNPTGNGSNIIDIDSGAGWHGPFTTSVRCIECSFLKLLPGTNVGVDIGLTAMTLTERYGGLEYRWLKLTSNISAFQAVMWDTATSGAVKKSSAGVTPTLIAGFARSAWSSGDWCPVYNPGQQANALSDGTAAVSIGDVLIPGAAGNLLSGVTANGAGCAVALTAASLSAVAQNIVVFFMPVTT